MLRRAGDVGLRGEAGAGGRRASGATRSGEGLRQSWVARFSCAMRAPPLTVLLLGVVAFFSGVAVPVSAAEALDSPRLWYSQPARAWTEALPVGNGRLGAMVFGGVPEERLQLNEDTVYAGGPHHNNIPGAGEAMPEIRRRIFAGDFTGAAKLAEEKVMPGKTRPNG